MERKKLRELLNGYKKGTISEKKLLEKLKIFPYIDMDFVKLDTHRSIRFGFPEVVYAPGKTVEQIIRIIKAILDTHSDFMVTRTSREQAEKIKEQMPEILYHETAGILTLKKKKMNRSSKYTAVVSAGTADIPVAEEAAVVLEILGDRVERLYDVGVAGLHRLLDKADMLNRAQSLIVVAGMEGALPSVVGGIVSRPVIAVPTSVGYGTNFAGVAPLLTMLNSCSPNVAVVNIDNGFGAAFFAHLILVK
ncbi:MAG TPA: nickel pincer cofactor biosynthesis protein LarB [bacterium]|nr:nickel pincer cofactor biosynthesis protein LarB [bacterium]